MTRELYWDGLVDPNGGEGEERLEWQFFRANVEPSERYVLSVPGSSPCRIPPDATGFVNLYAAGDWTSCANQRRVRRGRGDFGDRGSERGPSIDRGGR